jgi:hypothetical protein
MSRIPLIFCDSAEELEDIRNLDTEALDLANITQPVVFFLNLPEALIDVSSELITSTILQIEENFSGGESSFECNVEPEMVRLVTVY